MILFNVVAFLFIGTLFFFKPYLSTFRERVRESNINVWLPLAHP